MRYATVRLIFRVARTVFRRSGDVFGDFDAFLIFWPSYIKRTTSVEISDTPYDSPL